MRKERCVVKFLIGSRDPSMLPEARKKGDGSPSGQASAYS